MSVLLNGVKQDPALASGHANLIGGHFSINTPGANQIRLSWDGTHPDGQWHVTVGDLAGNEYDVAQSASLTGNLAASGAGGLDTGVKAATKCYVWRLITSADRSTRALLATLTGNSPVIPLGYTLRSDIIAVTVTDGAGNQYECCHSRGQAQCFEFDVTTAGGIPILAGGVATVKTAIGVLRALSTIYPAERREGQIAIYYEAVNTGVSARDAAVWNNDGGGYSLRFKQIGLADTPGERRQTAGSFLALVDGATVDTSLYYDWSGAPTGGLSLWVDKVYL